MKEAILSQISRNVAEIALAEMKLLASDSKRGKNDQSENDDSDDDLRASPPQSPRWSRQPNGDEGGERDAVDTMITHLTNHIVVELASALRQRVDRLSIPEASPSTLATTRRLGVDVLSTTRDATIRPADANLREAVEGARHVLSDLEPLLKARKPNFSQINSCVNQLKMLLR